MAVTTETRPTRSAGRPARPDIVIVGAGTHDAVHLTVDSQRILDRVGKAYAVHLPPRLARHLRSLGVKVVDLSDRFRAPRPFSEVYVEIVTFLLQRAERERPIVVLVPGTPMLLDSLSRLLVVEGRQRSLQVEVHPGVSPLDVLVAYAGLDVAGFGLQVFSASMLAGRRPRLHPGVPLLVLELAGLGARTTSDTESPHPARFRGLVAHLARFYPATHPVTLINTTAVPGARAHATLPLSRFGELIPHVRATSNLFVDARRRTGPASSDGTTRTERSQSNGT